MPRLGRFVQRYARRLADCCVGSNPGTAGGVYYARSESRVCAPGAGAASLQESGRGPRCAEVGGCGLAALTSMALLLQVLAPHPASSASRFSSKGYGLSIGAPANWSSAVGPYGLPYFFNFPPQSGLGQAMLPKGGSVIVIVPRDQMPWKGDDVSLSDWAEADARAAVKGTLVSGRFDMPELAEVSRAMIMDLDIERPGQRQHEVAIYWEFRGRRLAAYLSYLAGDPRAVRYRKVFLDLMRDIRPLK